MPGSIARTDRTADVLWCRGVEDSPEASDPAVDDFFVDDVGLIEPGLGRASGVFSIFTRSADRP